jgi:dTDP-4-dehydrorhamnose 3,5-epimerase
MVEALETGIEGLILHPLKQFRNDKGAVFHFLRSSDSHFEKFGEVYFSITNPEEIKGWKFHKQIRQNFVVPVGEMKFVFFDDREHSKSRGKVIELKSGENDYYLIQVPEKIWYSFKAISSIPAIIANCTTLEHSPDESINIDLNSATIPYQWDIK